MTSCWQVYNFSSFQRQIAPDEDSRTGVLKRGPWVQSCVAIAFIKIEPVWQ